MWRVYYGAKRMLRSAASPAQGPAITMKQFPDEVSALTFVAECRRKGIRAEMPVRVREAVTA